MLTANVLAWGFPLTVLLVLAFLERMVRLRRLRRQRVYADLAALSWVQFEQVIADAFRRHGYRVRETGGRNQADGGVDVVLQRDGETTIVQAKHWRRNKVEVTLVRESSASSTRCARIVRCSSRWAGIRLTRRHSPRRTA